MRCVGCLRLAGRQTMTKSVTDFTSNYIKPYYAVAAAKTPHKVVTQLYSGLAY